MPVPTRSPASLELLSLINDDGDNGDSTVELELSTDTKNADRPRHVAFRAPSATVLKALAKHAAPLRAYAQSASCVSGVDHLQIVVRVEGEEALALRFPDRALARIGPALEKLVEGLGANAAVLALAKW